MATEMRTAVISGGSYGIGKAAALRFADQGWRVAITGGGERADLPTDIARRVESGSIFYAKVDVADRAQVEHFASSVRTHFGENLGRFFALSSARLVLFDGMPDDMAKMRAVNVTGNANFFQAFRPDIERHREGSMFGAVSAFTAVHDVHNGFFNAYRATKRDRHAFVQGLHAAGQPAFNLVPGAVDTPKTRTTDFFSLLAVAAARCAVTDTGLRAGLAAFAGVSPQALGETPGAILSGIIGADLVGLSGFDRGRSLLAADGGALQYSDRTRRLVAELQWGAVYDRVIGALTAVDIVIAPEVVAEALEARVATGDLPPHGLLEVLSRQTTPSQAPIKGLIPYLI